jgi:hypothetical protein
VSSDGCIAGGSDGGAIDRARISGGGGNNGGGDNSGGCGNSGGGDNSGKQG